MRTRGRRRRRGRSRCRSDKRDEGASGACAPPCVNVAFTARDQIRPPRRSNAVVVVSELTRAGPIADSARVTSEPFRKADSSPRGPAHSDARPAPAPARFERRRSRAREEDDGRPTGGCAPVHRGPHRLRACPSPRDHPPTPTPRPCALAPPGDDLAPRSRGAHRPPPPLVAPRRRCKTS